MIVKFVMILKAVEPHLLVKENYIIISDPFKHD
jgi:hypothetical protein